MTAFATPRHAARRRLPLRLIPLQLIPGLALVLTLAACAGPPPAAAPGPAAAAPAEVIAPGGTRIGGLPFSPAVRAGDFIFLSGSIGIHRGTTELVSDDVGEQTRQTLANLETVLQAAGAGLGDVVKCTVFLVDMADYAAMNDVYATVWPGPPPARSTMAGSGLALGAKVEIECIAYAPAG